MITTTKIASGRPQFALPGGKFFGAYTERLKPIERKP